MASQTRDTIINALITQIDTQATALAFVGDAYYHTNDLNALQYPACLITEGASTYPNVPTSLQFVNMELRLEILNKSDVSLTTTDSQKVCRDLLESVVDAVNSDVTINGTCRYVDFIGSDQPFMWSEQPVFVNFLRLIVQYRRDV